MAYTKYILKFRDYFDREVNVFIIHKDLVAEPRFLTGTDSPLTISYIGSEETDAFQPMLESKATIRILLPEDDIELFEDIASMTEDTFGVQVFVGSPGAPDYSWTGWLVPDEQKRTFSYFNQVVELTAIDPIRKLKGIKLLNENKSYVNGKHNLKFIINRCFEEVFNDDNTIGTYDLQVLSPLVLDINAADPFPDILEQLSVYAEVFNDDMGRPISAYDVVKLVAESLFMRCFYEDGKVYMIDLNQYAKSEDTPVLPIVYKGHPLFDIETRGLLLGNSENISAVRTFRESRARFEYNGVVGLLLDGYLTNWAPTGGGQKLQYWDYSPDLLAQSDVYDRRIGTGRQEKPYGIAIQMRYDDSIPVPGLTISMDSIAGRTETMVTGLDVLKLEVKVRIANSALIPNISGGEEPFFFLPLYIIVYNDIAPAKSYRHKYGTNSYIWEQVDLTGTSFATDQFDFSTISLSGSSVAAATIATIERNDDKQTVDITMPELPPDAYGKVFVAIAPLLVFKGFTPFQTLAPEDASRLEVYSAILSRAPKKLEKETTKGEIVYVTRDLVSSQSDIERKIALNTTTNDSVAGALYTDLSYTDIFGETFPPGPVLALSTEDDPNMINARLLSYCAINRMYFNYSQYKIDFECKSKNGAVYPLLDLSVFVDPERASTDIYQERFIQTGHDYEVKTCDRKITGISMKDNRRLVTIDTLDETHDLHEYYFIT